MRKLCVLGLLLILSGCFSASPNSTFYNLTPIAKAESSVYNKPRFLVGVEAVSIPIYLLKPQIITRDADGVELTISEFNRWGEPLNGMLQRIIATDLAIYLPNSQIKPKGYISEQFDYEILVEITNFDSTLGKQATLDAWWSIFDKNGKRISLKHTDVSIKLGDSYDDLARAQSQLIAQMSHQIAAEINKF